MSALACRARHVASTAFSLFKKKANFFHRGLKRVKKIKTLRAEVFNSMKNYCMYQKGAKYIERSPSQELLLQSLFILEKNPSYLP
jgi:hypothetical protein